MLDECESISAVSLVFAAMSALACAPELGQDKPPPSGPFTVSDYFYASGAMGDGATPENLIINEAAACKERPEGARGHCYAFQYVDTKPYTTAADSTASCNWAGVFFQYPVNNWGGEPGLPIPGEKLQKVSFYAAVAAGQESVSFQIGGIGTRPGDPLPPAGCPPPDSEPGQNYDQLLNSNQQTIGTDWTKIEIPIKARYPETDIKQLIGAFAWSVSGTMGLPKTVYIDDLVYE